MRRPKKLIRRRAYTLVEILTATVLMLIIMMAVTVVFASVTESIGESRATLEMSQRLRAAAAILKQDLENVTVIMDPPRSPKSNEGYFQYVEGPIGPVVDPADVAVNLENGLADSTVGDMDDMILFTVTTKGEPYNGLIAGNAASSNSAEIIYFVRGTTLYRRILLIKPEVDVRTVDRSGFYQNYDLSVRKVWDDFSVTLPSGSTQDRPVLAANSLADLTRPECRFAHHPDLRIWSATAATPTATVTSPLPKIQRTNSILRYWREGKPFPFFLRPWLGQPYDTDLDNITANFKWVPGLGLPTLAECSDPNWVAGDAVPSENNVGIDVNDPRKVQLPRFSDDIRPTGPFDAWMDPHPWSNVDPVLGVPNDYSAGTRMGEDVLLTNVIGFDVKAWDPNAAVLVQKITDASDNVLDEIVNLPGDPGYRDTVQRLRDHIMAGSVGTSGMNATTGAYVDLDFMARILAQGSLYPDGPYTSGTNVVLPIPQFGREGNHRSLAYGTVDRFGVYLQPHDYYPAIYDTWSLHYEYNHQWVNYVSENPANSDRVLPSTNSASTGFVGDEDRNGIFDQATDGLDNDGANGVDDIGERETQPPYDIPLQGIQVRIRVFEPGSRQVREVTIVQKFRTK